MVLGTWQINVDNNELTVDAKQYGCTAVDLGGNLPAFAKQDAGEDSQTSYSHGGTNPVSSAGENDLAMIS